MNYYLDTSALVKLFHQEEGTDFVTDLINHKQSSIYILELAHLEILSAIQRRFRNGEINKNKLQTVITLIEHELNQFQIEPLDSLVIQESLKLLKKFGIQFGLRTLDAMHIACFTLVDADNIQVVTADTIMFDVAGELGYRPINPVKI